MRRWAAVAILVLLAGCAGKGKPAAAADGPTFGDLGLSAGDGLGLIRGVVVDQGIRPIAGVNVSLVGGPRATETDAEGRFGFSDVEPGLHFLKAARPGYGPVQTSVDVVAGAAEPGLVQVQVQRLPGTEPYVVALVWNGFMQCSWTAAGAFATGCLVGDYIGDDSRAFSAVDGEPTFLQSELLWQATQALGTSLCMRHYASEGIGGKVLMDDVCGDNPLLQSADADALNETGVGAGKGIERVVWVDGYGDHLGPGLAWSQRFDVYTHLFYNFAPSPGWRFSVDGAYPVPPA